MTEMPTWAPRFFSKFTVGDGCWEWQAHKVTAGYGGFRIGVNKHALAHRLAYELLVGPIPNGLVTDHLCRNRACVRPDHLEPVTNLENIKRGARAQMTHCNRGHEFTPENTYNHPKGSRICRQCRAIREERYAHV